MNNIKINVEDFVAHLSDIHIRYGSRHEEYKIVFQRTIEDLKEISPRRIVITGDVFHIKITMSPNAITLAGWFFRELSKIAPVDVILGNHDLNLQSKQQGNSIEPIVDLLPNGYIIKKGESLPNHKGNESGVFFFLDSGFYEVDDKIVYGVYSCIDNEMLSLNKNDKDVNKKYIALYHGPIYGCRSDNGYEMKGDDLINLSIFNNFDIVMLGDIHEHQAFTPKDSDKESIAYPGSLVQQGFGESLDKGYLLWDLENDSFERKFIPNDNGYSSLHISRGELVEERVEDLKFSNDPKRTKVNIVWEEYQENYSVEKEKQIESLVKTKYGCDNVSVECNFITKEEELDSSFEEDKDYTNSDEFIDLLKEFVENSESDNEEEVVKLAKKIDKELNYKLEKGQKWYIEKMDVWNLYSFPEKSKTFDFERMSGVTGILGKNFNGKSNIIRALVWILYKKMLGGGDSYRLVNMYTGSNEAGGRIYININSQKYYIERTVKVSYKKDGTPKVSYNVKYKKYKLQKDETYKWENVDSEKKATEKTERDNVITKSIGQFDDFTKIVLQAEKGEGNYLGMSQQPKNDLINKYLGLEIFRDRYDFAKKKFNEIKAKQKVLGNPKDYREKIVEEDKSIKEQEKLIKEYDKEILKVENENEILDKKIIEKTKSIIKVEETKYDNIEDVNNAIQKIKYKIDSTKEEGEALSLWLSNNYKKEVPNENISTPQLIESKINSEREKFKIQKLKYSNLQDWIDKNPKQKEIDITPINDSILKIKQALLGLNDKLIISEGKKCPTCGNVEKKSNPELREDCKRKIKKGKVKLKEEEGLLEKANNIIKLNNEFDKKQNEVDSIKNSLLFSKKEIDSLKKDLELSKNVSTIKLHNKTVEDKTKNLESLNKKLNELEKDLENLNKEIKIIQENSESINKNKSIEEDIKDLESEKKGCKLRLYQLNEKISDSKSSISVSKSNVEILQEKLKQIIEAEKDYGKYTIYLQAVHRDGIPARIIKRKLPIINYKINSILKNLVEFKIEMQIKSNGDIKEIFYFNSPEKDALSMSQASGSQVFIGSIAIRDSLHFVSSLTKPSLCIIDEGFGSLDEDLTMDMKNVFSYLKGKYQNILIITHKTEVKDFVDNIIHVTKDKKSLTAEQVEENPKAGISNFNINY